MDSPTQFILGGAIGHACFSHRLGRRAFWWGAIGGTIPDLDVLVIPFMGRLGEFTFHRGPTHSLVFGPVVGTILGYLIWKSYSRSRRDRKPDGRGDPGDPALLNVWIALFVLTIFTHPLLDVFTVYGTVLYWPFSDERVAMNGIAITDPVYTFTLVGALVLARRLRRRSGMARMVTACALVATTAYLFYGLLLNRQAEAHVAKQLEREGVRVENIRCYPVVLQIFLRRVVVHAPGNVLVGNLSMWKPHTVAWREFTPQTDPRVRALEETEEGKIFRWFALNQIASRVIEDGEGFIVEMDDIRYGFPGRPDYGIWGMRGRFDRDGTLLGDVEIFDRRPTDSVVSLFKGLLQATFRPDLGAAKAATQ